MHRLAKISFPAPPPGASWHRAFMRAACGSPTLRSAEAREWSKRPGHVVWIGLFEPDLALLEQVQAQFDLHPLAIEDARAAHQHPKLEQYGDALFMVARTAQVVAGEIAFGETHLFVGRGYVVSVRHGASTSYARVRERCESCPTVLSRGEDYILYAILDFIVDNYLPVVETIHAEVDELEDGVFAEPAMEIDVRGLYSRRRDLLRLRNAVAPLVDVCHRLEHAGRCRSIPQMQPLFRDVDRPHTARPGGNRRAAGGPRLCLRGEPDGRPGAADRDHPPFGGMGRHPRRTDRHRRHLRHEFPAHARA